MADGMLLTGAWSAAAASALSLRSLAPSSCVMSSSKVRAGAIPWKKRLRGSCPLASRILFHRLRRSVKPAKRTFCTVFAGVACRV